jgi:hypothetical protein
VNVAAWVITAPFAKGPHCQPKVVACQALRLVQYNPHRPFGIASGKLITKVSEATEEDVGSGHGRLVLLLPQEIPSS